MDVAGIPNRFCISVDIYFRVWPLTQRSNCQPYDILCPVDLFLLHFVKYTSSIKVSNQIKSNQNCDAIKDHASSHRHYGLHKFKDISFVLLPVFSSGSLQ